MKKTGLHVKIVQLFSSQGDAAENNSTREQQKENATTENREPGQEERIAMSDLEERRTVDIEDNNKAARMKIVRDADGKSYGTLQE